MGVKGRINKKADKPIHKQGTKIRIIDSTLSTFDKEFVILSELPSKTVWCYSDSISNTTPIGYVNKTQFEVLSSNKSHKELVDIAYKWVLNNTSCGIAFKELVTANNEIPDVIAFASGGHSILIEVKVSRSDFLCDKKKPFRKTPKMGMGTQRFYMCPTGLIKIEDLPEKWGLIYVNEKGRATCVHKNYKGNCDYQNGFDKNTKAEHAYMYSALRRLHIRGRLEEVYLKIDE